MPDARKLPSMVGESPPELEPSALAGPLGAWVQEVGAYTEADPAALMLSGLVSFGVAAGGDKYMMAGNRPQRATLFAMLVAESPKANRGLSWAVTRDLLATIDPRLAHVRVLTGLGNGRPLLDALVPKRSVLQDHRLLVFEPGVTRALRMASRPSSPLTWLLRNAWDGAPIELPGHARRLVVERHHVGVIAHATLDQLRPQLTTTDASASFVNRFVYVVLRRRKILPDEGNVPPELTIRHGRPLAEAAVAARGAAEMRRTSAAERLWRGVYEELAEDDPDGLLGIAVARSARHVLRMSLIYALADRSGQVGTSHIQPALAMWRYMRASAVRIFGDQPSDDLARRLLVALRTAGTNGMTLTEQAALFGRNVSAARLEQARQKLEHAGLVVTERERRMGVGRLATVTTVVEGDAR
jgi:hypothetical protein